MTKTRLLLASALIAISSSAFAAEGHDHKPLHGGLVMVANDIDFELVAKADQISLYVRDHGKPVGLQGAQAKLTLLTGGETREVQLQPAGDRLTAQGSFPSGPGTKVVAAVTVPGKKPFNVRFALK